MKDAKKSRQDGMGGPSAKSLEEPPISISTINAIQSYGLMQISDKYFSDDKQQI